MTEQVSELREISISEFFEKNKHLLGFDNPTKALLMAVKEAVDNSLDATEEAGILPDIEVKIKALGDDRYRVSVEDNGPGIPKQHIARVFGKLLFGSKFHRLKQNRGQQGIGICMTPDTLVTLADGSVRTIEDVVENNHAAEIFTLAPDLRLIPNKIARCWKIPAPKKMIRIKTLGGTEIGLTPENPVLVRKQFGIDWVPAELIAPGDFIAGSRRLNTRQNGNKIAVIDLLDKDTCRADCYTFLCEVLYLLRKRYGTWEEVGKSHNLKFDTIKGWLKKRLRRRPTISQLTRLARDAGFSEEYVIKNVRRVGRLGNYVDIPEYVDKDLLLFAGLVAGDGNVQKKRGNRWGINISFWNNEEGLLACFENLAKSLFNASTTRINHSKGRGACVQFSSGIIAEILEKLGVPSGKKSKSFVLPEYIQKLPDDVLSGYIRGLFDAEGSVEMKRKEISFMVINENFLRFLRLLLLRYGIICNLNKTGQHKRIIISNKRSLRVFRENIGFTSCEKSEKLDRILSDKVGKHNTEVVPFVKNTLENAVKELGITKHKLHYPSGLISVRRSSSINYDTLQFLCNTLLENCDETVPLHVQELIALLNSDVTWLRVLEVEEIDAPSDYVYDVSMGIGNNFLANGLVVHNSAVVLYSQLTTGNPTKVYSKTKSDKKCHYYELLINTEKNEPDIIKEDVVEAKFESGTRVEVELTGRYRKWVEDYLKQTSIANPFAKIKYTSPDGTKITYPRSVDQLPKPAKEMQPHPYGMEFGILQRMMLKTKSKSVAAFLVNEFSSLGSRSAKEICKIAKIRPDEKPQKLDRKQTGALLDAMQKVKIQRPPVDCLSPIGEKSLEKSLKAEFPNAELVVVKGRSPEVYRGFPFMIEVGIVYGGDLPHNETVHVLRMANRVPLLYQAGACATTEAVKDVDWKRYGLQQSSNSLPSGPAAVVVHMSSVWVPFVSESKEAVAPYPEITKEMKLAVQDAGRELSRFLSGKRRAGEAKRKFLLFERYSTEVAESLAKLTNRKAKEIENMLKSMIKNKVHIQDDEEQNEAKGGDKK